MYRKIIAGLLVPSVIPLFAMVFVQPRVGAAQLAVTPSPVTTWDLLSTRTEEAGQSPLITATATTTLSILTPAAVAATPASTETLASAEITALPTPLPPSASTAMPPATATPLSVAGVLRGTVALAQTNPATSAMVAGVCLLAVGVLLLGARSRRQRRLPAPPTRPLSSSVAILEGITDPNLKFYLDRDQMTVGRASDSDIRMPENVSGVDAISQQHARFEKRGERWAVIDGARDGELSTNGIYVNGKRTLENYLAEDDEISFGNLTFRFHARPAIAYPRGRGSAMSKSLAGKECPRCGTVNGLTAKECKNCGALLPASQTTQRIARAESPVSTSRRHKEKATCGLGPKGFGDLPLHAVVARRYEVIQQFNSRPDVNAYVVVNSQSQKQRILYESANLMQFEREQRWIASHLQHSALVEMEDAFQISYGDHSRAYLAVEFPLTPATSFADGSESELLEQGILLGQAFALAHDRGLAIGSIPPSSLFVSDHQIKLWGSAMPEELTPESRAQDVFQLASALYQLATAPGKTQPALSHPTMQVFEHALAPDPRARYPDVNPFCDDLQKVLDALRRETGIITLVGRLTDIGCKRERDEDALLTTEIMQHTHDGSRVIGLYAVADGMGGASAGEVASRIVVEALARHVTRNILEPDLASSEGAIDYPKILRTAVEQANLEVFNARQLAHTNMGSTLVSALLVSAQAYIANVGDSRAYVLSTRGLRRVTKDHSLVQALVDSEMIRETEIRSHPQRNYITRSMGDKPSVQVDLFSVALEPGDYLLLCCDGLWEMVEDDQIHRIVVESRDPQDACRQLIETAKVNGGDDNITCVLVNVVKGVFK